MRRGRFTVARKARPVALAWPRWGHSVTEPPLPPNHFHPRRPQTLRFAPLGPALPRETRNPGRFPGYTHGTAPQGILFSVFSPSSFPSAQASVLSRPQILRFDPFGLAQASVLSRPQILRFDPFGLADPLVALSVHSRGAVPAVISHLPACRFPPCCGWFARFTSLRS